MTGLSLGGLMVPSFLGKAIAAEQLQSTLDVAFKKRLADAALAASTNAAPHRSKVRIPPGEAARAAAAVLRGEPDHDGVVIDLSAYAQAANERNTLQ